jgi:hypothetical protein
MSKEIWSKDDLLLGKLECNRQSHCINQNGSIETVYNDYDPSNRFRTKERAELERDRREVDYIMKKMACESREDNDWKYCGYEHLRHANYRIYFNLKWGNCFKICCSYNVDFNQVYFNSEKDAQNCLNHLKEKYTEKRLKEIWGIK